MYTCIPSFLGFPSDLDHHRTVSRAPCCCTVSSHQSSALYKVARVYFCQAQSPDSSLPFFPAWCPYFFFFYVCVSVSTLHIGSSVPCSEERLLTLSACPSRTVTLLCLVRSLGRLETLFPQTWAPLPSEVGPGHPPQRARLPLHIHQKDSGKSCFSF